MTDENDYICVSGNFYTGSYSASTLTNGVMEVKGDFTEVQGNGTSSNFAPSGDHKVILSGEGLQTVSFARTESGFNILEITKDLE